MYVGALLFDRDRYTKRAPTPHRVRFEDDATGLDVGSEYHTSHATFSQNDSPADSQPASEYGGRNEVGDSSCVTLGWDSCLLLPPPFLLIK